jgi:hypothetical protein
VVEVLACCDKKHACSSTIPRAKTASNDEEAAYSMSFSLHRFRYTAAAISSAACPAAAMLASHDSSCCCSTFSHRSTSSSTASPLGVVVVVVMEEEEEVVEEVVAGVWGRGVEEGVEAEGVPVRLTPSQLLPPARVVVVWAREVRHAAASCRKFQPPPKSVAILPTTLLDDSEECNRASSLLQNSH